MQKNDKERGKILHNSIGWLFTVSTSIGTFEKGLELTVSSGLSIPNWTRFTSLRGNTDSVMVDILLVEQRWRRRVAKDRNSVERSSTRSFHNGSRCLTVSLLVPVRITLSAFVQVRSEITFNPVFPKTFVKS